MCHPNLVWQGRLRVLRPSALAGRRGCGAVVFGLRGFRDGRQGTGTQSLFHLEELVVEPGGFCYVFRKL